MTALPDDTPASWLGRRGALGRQEIITRDNVPARVTAVAYFRVIDPNDSATEVEDFRQATSQIAQTTLRSVLGKAELDALLVEIKDVEIPQRMQRSMARQAEAERERRAKVINAEGEYQAAQRLLDAADVISGWRPGAPGGGAGAGAARTGR